jgi:hypothetical protein
LDWRTCGYARDAAARAHVQLLWLALCGGAATVDEELRHGVQRNARRRRALIGLGVDELDAAHEGELVGKVNALNVHFGERARQYAAHVNIQK